MILRKHFYVGVGCSIILLLGVFFCIYVTIVSDNREADEVTQITPIEVPGKEEVPEYEVPKVVLPYGTVTLSINEQATFEYIQIRPMSIVEESRCPSDVNCIQAGRLVVSVDIVTPLSPNLGSAVRTLEVGTSITTDTERITLVAADPYPLSTRVTPPEMYEFTFLVEKLSDTVSEPYEGEDRPVPPIVDENPVTSGGCYSGGCSGQVCSDDPGAVSTCEYMEEYQCYRTAICERQANGACGWTETPALTQCLMSARANMTETLFIE